MKLKKMAAASFAGVLALVVTAGPAFADCINASRPDKANVQISTHSPSFLSLDEALLFGFQVKPDSLEFEIGRLALGLCPLRAEYLKNQILAAADADSSLGIDLTWVFSIRATQGGGVYNAPNPRARQNLSNGKGIDLLKENEEIWNLIQANIGDANLVSCA